MANKTKAAPENFYVKVQQQLGIFTIGNVLVSALEGGTGYWAQINNEKGPNYDANVCERIVKGEAHLLITDTDSGKEYRLDRKAVERGLQVMAEKYPQHLSDIVHENDDATTGDVLLQCALLGEVVYG